jgi:hypothetical protein
MGQLCGIRLRGRSRPLPLEKFDRHGWIAVRRHSCDKLPPHHLCREGETKMALCQKAGIRLAALGHYAVWPEMIVLSASHIDQVAPIAIGLSRIHVSNSIGGHYFNSLIVLGQSLPRSAAANSSYYMGSPLLPDRRDVTNDLAGSKYGAAAP